MSEILKGMTREQALGCVVDRGEGGDSAILVVAGKYWDVPSPSCGLEATPNYGFVSRKQWEKAINARFDEWEPTNKWQEAPVTVYQYGFDGYAEAFYATGSDLVQEIRRTNGRRKIEAFRDANCKSGEWNIEYDYDSCKFVVIFHGRNSLGAISFSDPKCAEEVIRRFPDELKLLAGVEG